VRTEIAAAVTVIFLLLPACSRKPPQPSRTQPYSLYDAAGYYRSATPDPAGLSAGQARGYSRPSACGATRMRPLPGLPPL